MPSLIAIPPMVRKTVSTPKRAVLRINNGHARLMPLGTFDFGAYADFNACVEQLEQLGELTGIEVDLGGVEEMDSAGLGALIELQQRLAPRKIRLSNAKWQPLMLIRSAKLWTIFDMERPKDAVDSTAVGKLFQRIRRQLSTRSPGLLESLNLLEIETTSLTAVTVAHLGGYLRGLNACGVLSAGALEDIEMAISEMVRR
jgi:anti-anti-sigma regulatory factor